MCLSLVTRCGRRWCAVFHKKRPSYSKRRSCRSRAGYLLLLVNWLVSASAAPPPSGCPVIPAASCLPVSFGPNPAAPRRRPVSRYKLVTAASPYPIVMYPHVTGTWSYRAGVYRRCRPCSDIRRGTGRNKKGNDRDGKDACKCSLYSFHTTDFSFMKAAEIKSLIPSKAPPLLNYLFRMKGPANCPAFLFCRKRACLCYPAQRFLCRSSLVFPLLRRSGTSSIN